MFGRCYRPAATATRVRSGIATEPTTITNYEGGVVTHPQRVVRPRTVEEIQAVLRDRDQYPGPVRPMGSFHSLTPCVSTDGTVVDMTGMDRILAIDGQAMTLTAQAGVQQIQAARALRRQDLQFVLNIEIGNLTLGSAACCQTKDALDCVEFGQISSYVTRIKWVTPAGELREASADEDPELLHFVRSSYGLCGIVYEVDFRIKPLEMVRFDYAVHDVDDLTQDHISAVIASNQSMVCWTVGRTTVVQTRNRTTDLRLQWVAGLRRRGWNHIGSYLGKKIRRYAPTPAVRDILDEGLYLFQKASYRSLSAVGGFSLYAPDKTVNYDKTLPSARYAFTFWTFPRSEWVANLKAYLEFRDRHFQQYGFRCNLPLGSYYIKHDTSSVLSYSHDGDTISLDPIHAPAESDQAQWEFFLQEFNAWAHQRGGIPLLNQSPFVERQHVVSAYGDRWTRFSAWVRAEDPEGRMLSPFFADLLSDG